MGGKNWKSVNKVHTDTPLLGYTKIRNTDISVSALIAVSKRRKTHPKEKLPTTPLPSLFESEMTHSHHILSFVQKSGDAVLLVELTMLFIPIDSCRKCLIISIDPNSHTDSPQHQLILPQRLRSLLYFKIGMLLNLVKQFF